MQSDWNWSSPAGTDVTARKFITAEQPGGKKALKVNFLQQIPYVQSCHSYGYTILSDKERTPVGLVHQSRKAIGHSQLHSLATFINFALGSKFTSPVVLQLILCVSPKIQQEPVQRLKLYCTVQQCPWGVWHRYAPFTSMKIPFFQYWPLINQFLWHPHCCYGPH